MIRFANILDPPETQIDDRTLEQTVNDIWKCIQTALVGLLISNPDIFWMVNPCMFNGYYPN